jgi:hypothetical protein
MGSPAFWLQPKGGATLKITLPDTHWHSVIVPRVENDYSSVRSYSGRVVRTTRSRVIGLTLEINRVSRNSDTATTDKLRLITDHLENGGTVGFTDDDDHAWLSYLPVPTSSGVTSVFTSGSVGWMPTAALGTGDHVICEQYDDGQFYQEHKRLSAPTLSGGTVILLSTTLDYDIPAGGWVRYAGYYPALIKASDSEYPETNEEEQTFSWAFNLTVPMSSFVGKEESWRALYTGASTSAFGGNRYTDLFDTFNPANGPSAPGPFGRRFR